MNPNLMMNPLLNPNMPNLPNMPNMPNISNLTDLQNNMMLAMMMNNAGNTGTNNTGTINKETSASTKGTTKNVNTIQPEINANSALNELRGLVSKYRHVINPEDKERMETLLDTIDQKLESI